MNKTPEPHVDDFVLEVKDPVSAERWMLCDRDVHPIRNQVQAIIDGSEAPLEWLTLRKSNDVLAVYKELLAYLGEAESWRSLEKFVPLGVQEKISSLRWRLVCLVTESIYGDQKYRAAKFYRLPLRILRRLARIHHLKRYSRMRKHELVYRLVSVGLG